MCLTFQFNTDLYIIEDLHKSAHALLSLLNELRKR